MEIISYSIEYKNELYQKDILTILQLDKAIEINQFNCYYIAIRFFHFNQIEISFYEEYYEIDDLQDKGRFQISIGDNPAWKDFYEVNDNLLYPDSEYIIKDINLIYDVVQQSIPYINESIKLYKQYLYSKDLK